MERHGIVVSDWTRQECFYQDNRANMDPVSLLASVAHMAAGLHFSSPTEVEPRALMLACRIRDYASLDDPATPAFTSGLGGLLACSGTHPAAKRRPHGGFSVGIQPGKMLKKLI